MDDDIANLPIDIHVGKLVDWLVSRQHATKDWTHVTRSIREKINEAIQDMPEHPEITKLLSGTYINYFHCLKIVDILRETEVDSKNILGWYTSQRMKDWQSIVKLYEKGGTSLAESGQLLHRYVLYEMPGIKAQMSRCKQIQQECDKREADIRKSATNAGNHYQRQLKQIGISGEDVRGELFSLVEGLPAELNRISQLLCGAEIAIEFYLEFIAFTCSGSFQDSLPNLRYIIEHGNVTTYEYSSGSAPVSIEDPFAELKKLKEESIKEQDDDAIDFGDVEKNVDLGSRDIDFGIEVTDGEIDFGGADEPTEIDFGDNDEAAEIDFGDADVGVELNTTNDGVARNKMALTILHNSSTRNMILDDIYELEGFLKQRLHEDSSRDESKMTLSLFEDAPKSLQMVSPEKITAHLSDLLSAVSNLTTPKMQHLFLISDSVSYVERLSDTLEKQKRRSHVSSSSIEDLHKKNKASVEQEQELAAQLLKVQAATKVLQAELEDAISTKYKKRPVNIMGVAQKG